MSGSWRFISRRLVSPNPPCAIEGGVDLSWRVEGVDVGLQWLLRARWRDCSRRVGASLGDVQLAGCAGQGGFDGGFPVAGAGVGLMNWWDVGWFGSVVEIQG